MSENIDDIKREAYLKGMHDQEVRDMAEDLKKHLDNCTDRSNKVWEAIDSLRKIVYTGMGVLAVLQVIAIPIVAYLLKLN